MRYPNYPSQKRVDIPVRPCSLNNIEFYIDNENKEIIFVFEDNYHITKYNHGAYILAKIFNGTSQLYLLVQGLDSIDHCRGMKCRGYTDIKCSMFLNLINFWQKKGI